MKLTLIISTYNSPQALRWVLHSALCQSETPHEVIIADDGSAAATGRLIEQMRPLFRCPLHHVWHPDEGFRKTVILNKAIRECCTGDYLVFVDGDIVMHRHFIKNHHALARQGRYVVGSRTFVSQAQTAKLFEQLYRPLSWTSHGLKNRTNALYMPWLSPLTRLYKRWKPLYGRGANFACWKADFVRVNGHDEAMLGWGLEDTDLINRLRNNGVRATAAKFQAIAFHLWHRQSPPNRENERLFRSMMHRRQCEHGLANATQTPQEQHHNAL